MFGHYIPDAFMNQATMAGLVRLCLTKHFLSCEIVPSILFIDLFRHTYMSPIHHVKIRVMEVRKKPKKEAKTIRR